MDSSSVTFVHCVEKCVDKPVEDMHTSPDNIELGELGDPDESFSFTMKTFGRSHATINAGKS